MDNRYICQAISHKIYDEMDGKAPQVGVELRVLEGPEMGKTLFWYGSLHENAQEFTVEALRNMGWSCNDITALTGLGDVKVNVVEKAKVFTDARGKERKGTQLQIWPIKTPKPTLEADSQASFAARYKALAAAFAPIERTDINAGVPVDALPAAKASGNGAAAPGPATTGTPF
jgi:hypothetical protein